MGGFVRRTFSLTSETADDIAEISQHLGISKSALANQLLGPACDDILRILDRLPAGAADAADRRRLRGESVQIIEDRLSELGDQVRELKSGSREG